MNNSILKKEIQWLLEEKYNGEKSSAFFSDEKKLNSGTPLAYLIGNIDFINTKIDLEFKPLIPRPETEFWIYEYIFPKIKKMENFAEQNSPIKILDIFSGSGCIGLSVLNNFKNIEIDFGEIKNENILQIKKNIKINSLENKNFNILQSDIFKSIPKKSYDFILANPPYISKEKIGTTELQNSVIENEDYLALFAKDNGLYFVKKLISESKNYLKKDGELWIEYDPWQTDLIKEFLKENNLNNFEIKKDQYNRNRFLKLIY